MDLQHQILELHVDVKLLQYLMLLNLYSNGQEGKELLQRWQSTSGVSVAQGQGFSSKSKGKSKAKVHFQETKTAEA